MTEDQAKTKACCGSGYRPAENGPCIASACMAWRWHNDYERRWDLPRDKAPEGLGWDYVEAIGGVAHWVRKTDTPEGFCGLAGAPR